MEAFLKEIRVKVPNEKETKMGILFEKLTSYIRERMIAKVSEKDKSACA
jgi:hypothetical protein